MKIYLIIFNKYDYDQYTGFVVAAESKRDMIKFLKKEYPEDGHLSDIDWDGGYLATEIKPTDIKKTKVILDSYLAG